MTFKIRKLYNVLVVGGMAAASLAACDRTATPTQTTTTQPLDPPAQTTATPDKPDAQPTEPTNQELNQAAAQPENQTATTQPENQTTTTEPENKTTTKAPAKQTTKTPRKPIPAKAPTGLGGGARGWH